MRANPYLNRLPVREPARFFGRARELRVLFEGLTADPPQSFAVVGDRRIGKSSLLHQLRHPDVQRAHAADALRLRYFDFQAGAPDDEPAFVDFLCGHVAEALGAPKPAAPCRTALFDLLGKLDAAGLRLGLLWDEFELVTRRKGLGPEVYALLRALAQNHRLAFVTATGRDLRAVCHSAQVADSPFFNFFRTLRLRPLARDEAHALIAGPSAAADLPLGAHAARLIGGLAGTFPFFLQIACAALFEHLDEHDGGVPDWPAVEERFLEEAEPHFRHVWEERLSDDERAVLDAAARGRTVPEASAGVAERLKREGYLAEHDGTLVPFSDCLGRFVRETLDAADRTPTPREGPAGPLEPGALLLGKYEIVSALGAGGMGQVFLARHVDLDRPVVVKVLDPRIGENPELLARFRREARAMGAIGHPNVVQVFDFDRRADGRPFLVMEYLEGEDLARRLYRASGGMAQPLPPGEAVAIAVAACDGLAAAHDRSVVHRDLKPGNLFLARPGTGVPAGPHGYVVKLLDFGVSRMPGAGVSSPLTRSSGMLGTPCYTAPEQIVDPSSAGPAADQYALGVVLYEMLTGALPFAAGAALSRPFATEPPAPPTPPGMKRPGIPAALDAAVLRTLAFDPHERFATVRDLAVALRRIELP